MKNGNELFDLRPRLIGELIEVRPLSADDWQEFVCGGFGSFDLGAASGAGSVSGRCVQGVLSRGFGNWECVCGYRQEDGEDYWVVSLLSIWSAGVLIRGRVWLRLGGRFWGALSGVGITTGN